MEVAIPLGIEWSTSLYKIRVLSRVCPAPPPPKYIVIITVQLYLSNYIGKIILTRRGQCTWSKYFLYKDTIWQGTWSWLKNKILHHCNILQNCTRLLKMRQIASQHIFIKKISGGHAPGSHQEATQDFSPNLHSYSRSETRAETFKTYIVDLTSLFN